MNLPEQNKAGTLPDSDPVKDLSRSKDTIFYTQLKATEFFFSEGGLNDE